jgi:uncharacterized protein YfaS (alpha-2-macroglobulin family)
LTACLALAALLVQTDAMSDAAPEVLLLDGVPLRQQAAEQQERRGVLLTDRALYNAGDEVLLKGYVRVGAGDGAPLAPPPAGLALELRVRWQQGGEQLSESIVTDGEFGAFSARLRIPARATPLEPAPRLHVLAGSLACPSRDRCTLPAGRRGIWRALGLAPLA